MATAVTKARLEAELKVKESMLKKHPFLFLKQFLEEHSREIPDWIAIGGVTLMVKKSVDVAEGIVNTYNKTIVSMQVNPYTYLGGLAGIVGSYLYAQFQQQAQEAFVKKVEVQTPLQVPEWFKWLIAFSIAVLIVKYGGQLLSSLDGGISKLSTVVGALV